MYKTISEINNEFKDEWVLITDCKLDEKNELLGGNVIEHNKEMQILKELIKKHDFKDTVFSIKYIGDTPRNKTLVW